MNIKSVGLPNATPVELKKAESPQRTKLENTPDRDAQAFYDKPEPEKKKLSDQELEEALQHLRGLPFVKDNSWQIRTEKKGDIVTVFVEDHTGKVIRRIPEQDLWGLLSKNRDQNKGNLLNKSL